MRSDTGVGGRTVDGDAANGDCGGNGTDGGTGAAAAEDAEADGSCDGGGDIMGK